MLWSKKCKNTGSIIFTINPLKNKQMQLTAKLIEVLAIQTGQGKNGEWRKQDIIVETEGQYPKKICISLWGDKISATNLQIGNYYKYDIDIESREYSGRWYTDVKTWRIELLHSENQNYEAPKPPTPLDMESEDDSGLPF
jgi:hypothetical protein